MRLVLPVVVLVLVPLACSTSRLLPPARVRDLPWGDAPAEQVAFAARQRAERGDVAGALRELAVVLEAEPRYVDARRLRQDLLRERGRRGVLWHEAMGELARHRDDAQAHYLAGRIARDPERKLALFERGAELAPQSVWPWLGLAHTLRESQPQRALQIYDRLFHAAESHPVVGLAYAGALRDEGRLVEAAAVYSALRDDPRARAQASLGLAQIALARDDRRSAWEALLAAVRGRPFDPAVQALAAGWLDSAASPDQATQLLDALREDPERWAAFAGRSGGTTLVALLQRSGQLQALRTLLERLAPDARRPALRRQYRHLLLALGDVRAFLDAALADVPMAVVDREPNRVRGRWLTLLRGPWYSGEPLADASRAASLLAALRDVGWLQEVELLAEAALRTFPDSTTIRVLRDEARAQLAFENGLRRRLYAGYRTRDGASLQELLSGLRELSRDVLGRDVLGEPVVFSAPLVGEMLDPFAGGLAAHLDRYNRHLVLGRRAGGVAEGLLLTRLSVEESAPSDELPLPARCFEVVGIDRDVRSLGGVLGGDLAGVALLNHFLIDYDAVREWAGSIADRRAIADEDGRALLADPLPAEAGDDPFDVSWRLAVMSPVQDKDLDAAVLDTIRHHERQHLVDSFFYLPIEHNLWRGLGLLFEFGFSPSAIEAEMERRAELASLAISPHTELVLAHIADFHADVAVVSPHHQGFGALAGELTAELVRQGVGVDAALPSRWHLLPMASVRQAARSLLERLP
jgi:hypothetical protein